MHYATLLSKLGPALAETLPGHEAQLRLAPRPRLGWIPGELPDDHRPGAGLLLVYPRAEAAHVLLTVRHEELPHHAGQVALPGGAIEAGETVEQAALREAREEVGLDAAVVRVLGRLTPLHIPASGFVLHPVVGVADRRPELRPDPREVARILEVPVARLADVSLQFRRFQEFRGHRLEVPFFDLDDLGGARLWGATAMILSEFLCLLGLEPDPWS